MNERFSFSFIGTFFIFLVSKFLFATICKLRNFKKKRGTLLRRALPLPTITLDYADWHMHLYRILGVHTDIDTCSLLVNNRCMSSVFVIFQSTVYWEFTSYGPQITEKEKWLLQKTEDRRPALLAKRTGPSNLLTMFQISVWHNN